MSNPGAPDWEKNKEIHNSRQVKKCPFLKEWCIGEECAIHSYLTMSTHQGMVRKSTCGFESMMVILPEINQKTLMPQRPEQPTIVLPFMGRG